MANILFKKTVKLFTVKTRKVKKRTILLIFNEQIAKPITVTVIKKLT